MIKRDTFTVIAGPCAVEEDTFLQIVDFLKDCGVLYIRGNLFKPRTHPESFQGLGEAGISLLHEVHTSGLKIVSEAMTEKQADTLKAHVDVIQVGARNMYNYPLLTYLSNTNRPVLLKRAPSATLEEFLGSAAYLKDTPVILCERGIRTFNRETRNTLDLPTALLARDKSDFPVIADPSHGTGRADLVAPMALAAAAAGLDGVMLEVHIEPKRSRSDPMQALNFPSFEEFLQKLDRVLSALGKDMG